MLNPAGFFNSLLLQCFLQVKLACKPYYKPLIGAKPLYQSFIGVNCCWLRGCVLPLARPQVFWTIIPQPNSVLALILSGVACCVGLFYSFLSGPGPVWSIFLGFFDSFVTPDTVAKGSDCRFLLTRDNLHCNFTKLYWIKLIWQTPSEE